MAVQRLAALAHETRLEVYRRLVRAGPAGLAAGDLSSALDLPPATLSFHLAQLRHAGLVGFHRDGRSLIYATEYAVMNELLGYLTDNCCQGDPAACGPSGCSPSTTKKTKSTLRDRSGAP